MRRIARVCAMALACALQTASAASAATLVATTGESLVRIDDASRDMEVLLRPKLGRGLHGSFVMSPDGTEIAYLYEDDPVNGSSPDPELRVAPLDGSPARTIIKAANLASSVSWSPDGQRVIFDRTRATGDTYHLDTWEIGRSGGAATRLVRDATAAEYSPDGSRLAYTRLTYTPRRLEAEVMVRDLLTGMTRTIGDGFQPAWSPDASQLAYVSWRDRYGEDCRGEGCGPATELYVADLTSGTERRVTKTKGIEEDPSWSPDGQRIAVTATRETRGTGSEVWTFSPAGGCAVQLTWMGPGISGPDYEVPGPETDTGGPACGTRPEQYTAPDVTPAGPHMLYPGIRYRGGLLTDVDQGFLVYTECDLAARECPPELQLQAWSICDRSPAEYGSPGHPYRPRNVWKRRGAIIAVWPSAGGFDVYSGSTALAVFGVPARHARAFVDRLHSVEQSRPHGKLASPMFTRRGLKIIRSAPELRAIAKRLPAHVAEPKC